MVSKTRVRITKAEIEKAKEKLLAGQKTTKKQKSVRTYKDFWYGLVYCDHQGLAVIATQDDNACILGKTEEVIKVLKEKKADKEDTMSILRAIREFEEEKRSQSYHLATENSATGTIPLVQKSNRITFKNSPLFLRLLDSLIAKGMGIPTIQRELKAKGYDVPYATLGRWINKRKEPK